MPLSKYELEYPVKSSPRILFNAISSQTGLADWFADKIDVRNDIFTFSWNGSEEKAKLIAIKENESVRFQWLSKEDPEAFFEFKIRIDELTGDVALLVTDFCEDDELDEAKRLWDHQIHDLFHAIGS
jgi:uncharacterized protein YndB with AHSA1/START domain